MTGGLRARNASRSCCASNRVRQWVLSAARRSAPDGPFLMAVRPAARQFRGSGLPGAEVAAAGRRERYHVPGQSCPPCGIAGRRLFSGTPGREPITLSSTTGSDAPSSAGQHGLFSFRGGRYCCLRHGCQHFQGAETPQAPVVVSPAGAEMKAVSRPADDQSV